MKLFSFKVFFILATVVVAFHLNAVAEEPVLPVKWSQVPDMSPYGYDFSSETMIPSKTADDFLCESALPIIDLHWWGSYWTPSAGFYYSNSDNFPDPTTPTDQPPGILQGFNIEFYADVPASGDPNDPDGMPWSHPGDLLYEEFVPITQVSESLYGTIVHIGDVEENVWQYNVDLPRPFDQVSGTIYWLKIQAVHYSSTIQWGWHEADSLWHDNAVQMGFGRAGKWELLPDKDMAFELSVPEPTAVFFLLPGIGFLVLLLKRRSKR